MNRISKFLTLAAVACSATFALAQDTTAGMAQVDMTMKPSALTAEYKALVIKQAGAGGGIMDMLMSPMMMMMGALGSMGQDKADEPPFALLSAMDLSWTKGETQGFWGQTYLMVYRIDMNLQDIAKMGESPDLTNANMRLQFIRTDSIQSMTPRPDVTPELFLKMLKAPPKAAKPAPKPAK